MTKQYDEDFKNSTKYCICDNDSLDVIDVKVRDHCHITGKYRSSGHMDCKIKVKLNHKFLLCSKSSKFAFYILLCKNLVNSI